MIKILLILLVSISTFSKPLYELGIGNVGFYSPHYPGSEQSDFRNAVLPLVIYRGEYVHADQEGISGDISKKDWYTLDLSVAAAFPANSEDNDARRGMDDLDWLVEIGPSFEIHLYKSSLENLDLRLQPRAIVSSDFSHTAYRGWKQHLMFYYEKREFFKKNLTLFLRAGSIYGSEKINDYFYEVGANDITSDREKFDARAGYIESHFDIGLSYIPNDTMDFYLGFQRNFYKGAKNRNSPLHRAEDAYSVGIGMTWVLFKSKVEEI